ncbi:MAG: hypothetical protein WKF95_08100 [Rubrobacter sp.]
MSPLLSVTFVLLMLGCSPPTSSEGVAAPPDSLRLGDVIYERLEPAEVTDRGPLAGRVERLVSDNLDKSGYEWLESGDSNYLEPNTLVYAAKDYDPAFRVVARGGEGWTLYEVAANRSAKRAAALLDVGGKTYAVSVREEPDAASGDAYPFRGRKDVVAFVDAMLGTLVERISADYSPGVFLIFKLDDGTEAVRFYEPGSGELYLSEKDPSSGIVLPMKLQEDLRRTL